MKKIQKLFLVVLLFLPLIGLNNNNYVADTDSPISSSGSGGLGKVWEKRWIQRGSKVAAGSCILNESLYVVQTVAGTGYNERAFMMVKWSLADGSIIWQRSMDLPRANSVAAVAIVTDNTSVYTATRTIIGQDYSLFLTKWNQDGSSEWNVTHEKMFVQDMCFHNNSLYVSAGKIFQMSLDDGSIIWQTNNKPWIHYEATAIDNEVCLVKWSDNGTLLWDIALTYSSSYEVLVGGISEHNGSVYVTGFAKPEGMFLFKVSTNGTLLWNKTWSLEHSMSVKSILIVGNEIYVGGGTTYPGQYFLTKWSNNGALLWNQAWGEDYYENMLIADILAYNDSLYTLGMEHDAAILTKWIEDDIPPTISSEKDVRYEQSDFVSSLDWWIYDENPCSYTIFKNDSIVEFGNWTSPEEIISIQINKSVSLGDYNYTIVAMDLSGSIATDSCIVTIEDTTNPYLRGSYSNNTKTITWVAEDKNPNSYSIYKDGEEISSGDWVSGGEISISVSPERRNSLNYTIMVRDTSGNINSDSIVVPPLSGGTTVVFPFSWWEILLVIVGIALAVTITRLILLAQRNHLVITEKVYTEH